MPTYKQFNPNVLVTSGREIVLCGIKELQVSIDTSNLTPVLNHIIYLVFTPKWRDQRKLEFFTTLSDIMKQIKKSQNINVAFISYIALVIDYKTSITVRTEDDVTVILSPYILSNFDIRPSVLCLII